MRIFAQLGRGAAGDHSRGCHKRPGGFKGGTKTAIARVSATISEGATQAWIARTEHPRETSQRPTRRAQNAARGASPTPKTTRHAESPVCGVV
jgi:hypothetical protein